jgi:TonB family protein
MVGSVVLFVTQVACQGSWTTTAWSTAPAIYVQGAARSEEVAQVQLAVLETIRFASPQAMENGTSCAGGVPRDTIVRDVAGVPEKAALRAWPPLEYPRTPRKRGIQGQVLVAMVVNADGSVDASSAEVVERVDPELDAAALGWARRAHFWPACVDGAPVRVRLTIPVDFKISGR